MNYPLDLYVIVADLDQQQAIQTLLEKRTKSLGIRSLAFEVRKHPRHDAGCYNESPALLQTLQTQAQYAIVVFDREGCGVETSTAQNIEEDLEGRLASSGWGQRARTVVIDPELEIWVWSPSPHVDEHLGWRGRSPSLREWLVAEGWTTTIDGKPERPKEAMLAALQKTKVKRSAAIFASLASDVSVERCHDRSFLRLCHTLRGWFAISS